MAREPRVIRGRLRHCDGIQAPIATGRSQGGREGGSEVRSPKVRIPVWLRSSDAAGSRPGVHFSDKEKDEARPGICFCPAVVNAFIPPLWG